ncbi:MAG TPA: thrombospondin type 3 repeat-containing protein [Kiritimatiellia bacterium]|nr:thrombospondin type 3 repeat-containing protein [Kiritimatiellia bacterium]
MSVGRFLKMAGVWGVFVGLLLVAGEARGVIPTNAVYNTDSRPVLSLDFSVTNRFVALGLNHGTTPDLRILNWRTNAVHLTNTVSLGNRSVEAVRWHRTQYWLAVGTTNNVSGPELYVFNVSPTNGRFTLTNTVEVGAAATAIAWHPTQNWFLVGSHNSTRELALYQYGGSEIITVATFNVHSSLGPARKVQRGALAWHPNGSNFVVGLDYNNTLNEWNLQVFRFNGTSIAKVSDFNFALLNTDVTAVDISSSGTLLAVGLSHSSDTNQLRIFRMNPHTGALTAIGGMPTVNRNVTGVHWFPGGELLAVSIGGSGTGEDIRIYQWNDLDETLTLLDGNVLSGTQGANMFRWSRELPFLGSGDGLTGAQAKFFRFTAADLRLTMTTSTNVVCSGSNFVYTLSVTNRGPDAAPGVTLRNPLPPTNLISYLSVTSTVGVCDVVGGELVCWAGTLATGSWFRVTITARVDVAAMWSVTNSASVTSAIPDTVISDNFQSVTNFFDFDCDGVRDVLDNCPMDFNPNQQDSDGDGVGNVCDNCPFVFNPGQEDSVGDGVGDACRPIDVGISMVADPGMTQPGSNIVVGLFVTNFGPRVASNVVVVNTFPVDLGFAGISLPTNQYVHTGSQVTMALGNMASGAVVSVTLTGVVQMSAFHPFTNRAEVTTTTEEGNLGNNVAFVILMSDRDGDGIADHVDNCPFVFNPGQDDMDGDGIGDACDPDMDGDYLPTDWELLYGFNPFEPTLVAHETCVDSDGDGFTNLDEFIAGTHPLDSNSFFRVSNVVAGGGIELTVGSVTGRYYHVYVLTDLVSQAWAPMMTNVVGQAGVTVLTDTNPAAGRFYRVKVSLQDWWPPGSNGFPGVICGE